MSPATPEGDSNTSDETDPDLLENNDELLTSDHSVDSEIDHTYQPLPVLEILNRYCKGRGNGEHKDHGVNPAGDHLPYESSIWSVSKESLPSFTKIWG